MHRRWKEIMIALTLGLVFPGILHSITDIGREKQPVTDQEETQIQTTSVEAKETNIGVLMDDGTIELMQLEDYLVGVVLREMPAKFETEALKAQAVVARTYTLRRLETGGKHTGAAVCTDSSCCQGFRAQQEYLTAGGEQELLDKVIAAVNATSGEVLVYNHALIEATYFSCSGGRTEDALAVWGTDIPYLQSIESPGEERATYHTDTVTFSLSDFTERLGLDETVQPHNLLGSITYTDGGGIEEMQVGGKTYKGTTIREKLGLRSTAFLISVVGDRVTITTKGFGHRVGMSQYGADAMAVQSKTYREILSHYYQGTNLIEYAG